MGLTATKLCALCGEEFVPRISRTIYCYRRACKIARQKARWEKWREKQDDALYRESTTAKQRDYRQRTGYDRDYELRTKYGINTAQWHVMLEVAQGKCEICGYADEALCVDHDHVTGRIRGVLCRKCNRSMGQLGDDLESLRRAVRYLEAAELGRVWPDPG